MRIGTIKTNGRATCTRCGCKGTEERPLIWDEDPYDADIKDDHTAQWMHGDCRDDSAQDV